MRQRYLIGVDVGTSNTKALLLDTGAEGGRPVAAVAVRPTVVHHPRPEWSDFDPEELWAGVVACVRQVVAACPAPAAIGGIAVASMGEAGVPLDAEGRPTYPVIAWYDARTAPQRDWWDSTIGAERTYAICGMPSRYTFGAHKLRWLRENRPAAFACMRHWLSVHDYILYRLSGAPATDYTLAARTLLFDNHARDWSSELLERADLPRALFPPAVPSGTAIGAVTAEAARQTGLPAGTPVVTGGHDHLCGAFAAGVLAPGTLLDSAGTAEGLLLVRHDFADPEATRRAWMGAYHHVVPGQTVLLGSLHAAGGLVQWVRERFFPDETEAEGGAMGAVAAVPPGSGGLVCLPFLQGGGVPDQNPDLRASFVGLRPHHDRAALLRAALEGLGYWLSTAIDYLEGLAGRRFDELIVTGGVSRFPLWMQIKADVTGRRLRVPQAEEAVALGAALLAGLGSGIFDDAQAAQQTLRLPETIYEPVPTLHAFYRQVVETVYRPLYRQVYDSYAAIAALPPPPGQPDPDDRAP